METPAPSEGIERNNGIGQSLSAVVAIGGALPPVWMAALASLQDLGLVRRVRCVGFGMQQLFEGVDFSGTRVLDIGGGFGMASLFAAAMGASEVVCLEPGSAGSDVGTLWGIQRARTRELTDRVCLLDQPVQSFLKESHAPFDVIISNNSINHLDERACIQMREASGRSLYLELLSGVRAVAAPGAHLVVSDCTRTNFLEAVGLRHPLRWTIEWQKHWNPPVWIELIEEAGFTCTALRYLSLNTLGRMGTALMNNRVSAYLGSGGFRITAVGR